LQLCASRARTEWLYCQEISEDVSPEITDHEKELEVAPRRRLRSRE
jgi:hypothetical protein